MNGTGITNGTRAGGVAHSSRRHSSIATRWQFLSVLVVLIVVVSSFVYLSYANGKNALSIDGRFNDWAHTEKFTMNVGATAASIDVNQWAVRTEGTRLYLYVDVQGSLMGSQQVDSFYLFVDSDDYALTGYKIGGLGADFLLQIDGWNSSVRSSSLCRYTSPSDQYNWTAWSVIGSVNAAIAGSQLEAMADISLTLGSDARYLLLSQNELDQQSVSYVVPKEGGTLVIRQEPITDNMTDGTVPKTSGVGLLRLNLFAEGAGGTVTSILPTVIGGQSSGSLGPVTLKRGESRTLDVVVDTSASSQGALVSVEVRSSNVESDFSELSLIGDAAKAYVAAAPSAIAIDGAFGDWIGRTSADTDSLSVRNPDVDIDSTGAVNSTQASYFFASVKGSVCNGSFVPAIKARPSGSSGGGGFVVPARVSGEDRLMVFIDSDRNISTGLPLSMSTKVIGADYMVEIRGMNGAIDTATLSVYQGGLWSEVPGNVVIAANDLQRIEIGVVASAIADSSSIDYIIQTTDWRGNGDVASSVPHGFKGASAGIMALGIESWLVDGSTSSPSATATSIQRKLFYDGVHFWSFYWSGTDTVSRYSLDNGTTWSAPSPIFKGSGVNFVSIWYDRAANIVYAVGDTSSASRAVTVQRGVISTSTHSISWAASDRTPNISTVANGSKQAYICKDAAGYLWILALNHSSTTPARYDLTAIRSNAIDSITTWSWSGTLTPPNINSDTMKGSIVPAGTGSQVWAVYTYQGIMASRFYNGVSWSAQTSFFVPTKNLGATDLAPPSVLVDSRGVIHCVYGDDNEQPVGTSKPHIYYTYNRGSGWSTPLALSNTQAPNGFEWPTISLDTSTGDVYAFWYDIQTNSIVGKRNVSGTWTSLSFVQNTYSKQYLTSIYSAPAAQFICWQWTQNTTAPIQVVFDKIPEFGQVALPIFLTMMVFFAFSVTFRRKQRR